MESISDCLSPESTITSLLSLSGPLRSGLQPPGRSATFRFRDQDFESASAALDAYIADFDRSRQPPPAANRRTARNRDGASPRKRVLRERLTDSELDFLSLPISSLRHRQNRHRVSMTTEELLAIPCDGSLPVTRTSAFVRGVLCRSEEPEPPFVGSGSHVAHRRRHPDPPPKTAQNQNRSPARASRSRATLQTDRLSRSADLCPASADLHLPRWLTSNRSALGCSEVSSLPDLSYPSWVLRAAAAAPEEEPPPAPPPPWAERGDARGGAPSWVLDLEEDGEPGGSKVRVRRPDRRVLRTVGEGEQTLGELRLQLAGHISALAAEGNGPGGLAAPFRDSRIEALIHKADQVLDALSSGGAGGSGAAGGSEGTVSPVGTEDLLRSSPPRCPSSTLTSGATEPDPTLPSEEVSRGGYRGNGARGGAQPGPVEAVKQMLFRLQAVEAELQRQRNDDGRKTPEKQEADVDPELQSFPGSPSLQRVGLYLNRLKLLVEDPGHRGRPTDSSPSQQDPS